MADPKSYREILEDQKMIEDLIDMPCVDEDERQELASFWRDLKSREAYKFDAIINVIKECDRCIDQFTKDLEELSGNVDYWKSKRQKVINIIKLAYQNELISSKPTGVKYQATIKRVKPKVEDNFSRWTEDDKAHFAIKKTVSVERTNYGIFWRTIPLSRPTQRGLSSVFPCLMGYVNVCKRGSSSLLTRCSQPIPLA